ncbi:UBX domain-containing [Brachionus plicatilis]|uniref:UBX domain-containing n=1 Tax=Brachionus plicatilis TaxID=10195 RepID=A0A3M7RV47_BRAPC|nr:UBX domain-containing [Brachionus plicatilis]
MSSNTNRPRRITRSSNSNPASSSSSGSSRPVRSNRSKVTVHKINDTSSESDSDDIKPIETTNLKKIHSNHSNGKVDQDKLNKLESLTGLSRVEATRLLEAVNHNLEQAIESHFSNGAENNPKNKNGLKRTINHVEDTNSSDSIYASDENVRAPIQPKSEKLLDYDPYALSVEPQAKRVRNEDSLPCSSHSSKAKSLAALYKPPVDLLFRGSFEMSKTEACKKNLWILINVQDQSDFACQCLNRDLWRQDAVKEIIKANFLFVQLYFDSIDGKKMINYYRIDTYPFIAILDPRTGENVMQFNNTNKLDQFIFCEKVTNFLAEHDMPIGSDQENGESENVIEVEKNEEPEPKKTIKASELIKDLNGEDSNSSEESIKIIKTKTNRLESSDEEDAKQQKVDVGYNYQPKMLRFETPDLNKKDCVIRILYPNGDRLDFSSNGECKFKELVNYLKKQGFKNKTHELIERLMPTIKSSEPTEPSSSQTTKISKDLSNLIITNQSRNLFNFENEDKSFKELNLFPRVFLLLQEL